MVEIDEIQELNVSPRINIVVEIDKVLDWDVSPRINIVVWGLLGGLVVCLVGWGFAWWVGVCSFVCMNCARISILF